MAKHRDEIIETLASGIHIICSKRISFDNAISIIKRHIPASIHIFVGDEIINELIEDIWLSYDVIPLWDVSVSEATKSIEGFQKQIEQ